MGASLNLKMITKDSDLKQGVNPETKAVVAGRAFNVRSANEVLEDASGQEIPNMLFGEFIFEGELTALYAPTNRGKSFLALHIAHLIASGKSLNGLENEADSQKVIFFDLELSKLQFQARYSEEYKDAKGKRAYKNQFKFHDNLMIAKFAATRPPKGIEQVERYFSQSKAPA